MWVEKDEKIKLPFFFLELYRVDDNLQFGKCMRVLDSG